MTCYIVWKRNDYSKIYHKTEWLNYKERFGVPISSFLLDSPTISDDGNLLIDEEPNVSYVELNLRTNLETNKIVDRTQDYTPDLTNYRHKNTMIFEYKEPSDSKRHLRFCNRERRVFWQRSFSRKISIIGWSEKYIAALNRQLG
jgi:hypothetical protein